MDKIKSNCVPIAEVLVNSGYVPWPPKYPGDECECGCKIVGDFLLYCEGHKPPDGHEGP